MFVCIPSGEQLLLRAWLITVRVIIFVRLGVANLEIFLKFILILSKDLYFCC